MSVVKFVDTKKPEEADAMECADCEGARDPFYKKPDIEPHADSFPLHTHVTYLRREVV